LACISIAYVSAL